jgi:hypothetical protein
LTPRGLRGTLRAGLCSCVLLLPGCAVLKAATPGSAVTPSPALQVTLAEGQLGIDTLYNGAVKLYLDYYTVLTPANKAKARSGLLLVQTCVGAPPNRTCTGYLPTLHAAYKVGDQPTLLAQEAQITKVVKAVKALMPAGVIQP